MVFRAFRSFGWQDEENHYCWTVGGWQNYDLLLSRKIHGRCSDLTQSLFRVDRGREYALKLQVSGKGAAGMGGRQSVRQD